MATEYLESWFQKTVDIAKQQKDTIIFELSKTHANKIEFEELIEKEKPQLIIFNGHGGSDVVCGYEYNILVKCPENHAVLKGKIVHALSCDSGKTLGPECIKIGTLAYLGYNDEFKLTTFGKNTNEEQLADDIAGFFLDPAFEAINSLVEGKTAKESFDRSQKMHKENLMILLASPDPTYNTSVASRLFHNLCHQVCLGDQSASF
jgi:hypothetical protein